MPVTPNHLQPQDFPEGIELDLLVVAPHPDDAEISVGGTLIACREAGFKVGVVELTDGEPTPHGSPEIRKQETAAATKVPPIGLALQSGLTKPQPAK